MPSVSGGYEAVFGLYGDAGRGQRRENSRTGSLSYCSWLGVGLDLVDDPPLEFGLAVEPKDPLPGRQAVGRQPGRRQGVLVVPEVVRVDGVVGHPAGRVAAFGLLED